MKRFSSKYKNLIRMKKQAEQMAQLRQASLQQEFVDMTDNLERLEQQLTNLTQNVQSQMGSTIEASSILDQRQQLDSLQHAIRRVRQSTVEMEQRLEQATEERVVLARDVETLRLATDDELKEHHRRIDQANQRDADDNAVRRWTGQSLQSRKSER